LYTAWDGSLVINGNVECSAVATYLGGFVAQADWLGPKVGGRLALVYIYQMNRVNPRSSWAVMTAPKTLSFAISAYLADTLQPVAGLPGRQRLRSSLTSALAVPLARLSTISVPRHCSKNLEVCHQK